MGDRVGGQLEGIVALVTGATSGIGEATARRFVAEGASVVLAGRGVEQGEAIAAALGPAATFQRCDVLEEGDVAAAVATAVDRYGHLDCLFNNAGAPTPGELETVTAEEVDFAVHLLVRSVLFGMKHAVPALRAAGGGTILNNASPAGARVGQGSLLYSMAKAAVIHLSRLAAVELGPDRIRVNTISPGAIHTPIFWGGTGVARSLSDEDNRRKAEKLERNLARATPVPRAGRPEDIAEAAVFLAGPGGSFVNGHDLVVDGGRSWAWHEPPAPSTEGAHDG